MATVVGFQQYFAGLRWFTRGFTIVDWISTVFRWSSIGLFLNLPCRSGFFGSVAGGAITAEFWSPHQTLRTVMDSFARSFV